MPFFKIDDFSGKTSPDALESILWKSEGEFTHAAVRTKQPGKPGNPHRHDDEEQWTIVLEGKMKFLIGDEEKVCGPGDVAFVPRFADHCSCAVDETAKFFRVTHKLKK
ncbi:MAG: cupin domain-containing protein [Rhodospirillaceae bacterium]